MASSADNGSLNSEGIKSILEGFLDILQRHQDDDDDSIIGLFKHEDTLDFFCTRMFPRAFHIALEHNLLSDIDEQPTEPDWLSLRDQLKAMQHLAPDSSSAKLALTIEDTGTPENPAALENIETLDNAKTPRNAMTSEKIALSENNMTPDDVATLKNAEISNAAPNLDYDRIPENVKKLSPSFQLWTTDPISYWQQQQQPITLSELRIPGIRFAFPGEVFSN